MVLPLCRCRVLYIGSAVPTITKDGLQGIQQPLRERYPVEDTPETRGIDSWLSVWSNGILLEYIEGDKKSESIFFPINTLHYCAAVRYVNVTGYAVEGGGERFLPLDSPFADIPDSPHPPIFAAILRRTTGVRVLECHGFICSNAKAANALVRCCFHAYADCMYLKMEDKLPGLKAIKNQEGSTGERSPASPNSDEDISVEAEDHPERRAPSGWERRQQEGEYDSVSISSSMLRHPNKASSETGARHQALVPFEGGPRRAGSDADLSSFRDPRYPPFMPPPGAQHRMPPGMFPPPPPNHPMFRGGPPFPPHFFPPPPPGAHFPPPHFRGPPPPPFMFMPPPPPHHRGFFHPPPFPMGHPPFRPPSPEGGGPIITGPESIYGTMRRGAYEEPAYVASGPPESSYQPSNFNHDQYEAYYDTLKKKGSKKGSVGSKDVWEQYEAGIYRRPHINERAFSNTLRETAEKETMSATLKRGGKEETVTQTATAEIIRPDTPPVDYDSRNGVRAH